MEKPIKVRWAFDPYHFDQGTWARLNELLLEFSKNTRCQIIPTYVVGHDLTHWVGHAMPGDRSKLIPKVTEVINEKTKENFSALSLESPDVFVSGGYSKRSDSESFIEHIKNTGTDLIVTSSHAYRGMKRFFLGSFAEGILNQSGLPTFLVSPHTDPIRGLAKTIFPTDLSEKSFNAFSELLISKIWMAKELFLYHRVHQPSMALLQTSSYALDGGQVALEEYFGNLKKTQENKIKAWNQASIESGVNVTTLVEDNPNDLSEIILSKSRSEGCDYVTMPSFAGKIETALVGSLAKEVARKSCLPVLIWHMK